MLPDEKGQPGNDLEGAGFNEQVQMFFRYGYSI
jgi:hypothetical protein